MHVHKFLLRLGTPWTVWQPSQRGEGLCSRAGPLIHTPRPPAAAPPRPPPRPPGAFTLSALEGKGGRDSPQTLVTAILRADFGGWLSPSSIFFQIGWALGLQEAFMDRLLMGVMVLREEVEYSK
jgi:hypothetical protein